MSTVVLVLLGAAVYIVGGWWLVGRLGNSPLEPPTSPDEVPPMPPNDDEPGIAFDTAVRGYRMDEVDAAVSQLQQKVREQHAEIERLRAQAQDVTTADESATPAGSDEHHHSQGHEGR